MEEDNVIERTKRIEYIDCMRGFTMLLVVFQHIFNYVFQLSCESEPLLEVLRMFRMPLFFFISGFLAYKLLPTREWYRKQIKNRLQNQFFPSFVTGSLYVMFIGGSFYEAITSPMKYGYWFTITLFEVFCIYMMLLYFMEKIKMKPISRLLIYTVIIVACCFLRLFLPKYYPTIYDSDWSGIIGIRMILNYTPFFLIGIIAKMYLSIFLKCIARKGVLSLILVAFVALFTQAQGNKAVVFLLGILGILMVYGFFHHYGFYFNSTTQGGKCLSYIGRNTLPIYFLHYFFLQGMLGLQSEGATSFLVGNWVLQLVVGLLLAIIIVTCCLFTDKFLRAFPVLHALMLGPGKKS